MRTTRRGRAPWAALAVAAWTTATSAAPAAAQTAAADAPAPAGVARVHVGPRPGSTLVAVTAVIPTGAAADPADAPGTARLLAATLAEAARAGLDADATRLEVRVERGWTAFTLLAPPELWARAWETVEEALFRLPIGTAPLRAARARLLEGAVFETGTPVREFERELYRLVAGPADPWSRDPRGDPAVLRALDPAALEAFRAVHYRPESAAATVVGVVDGATARTTLAPIGSPGGRPAGAVGPPAWSEGDRLRVSRDVTNAWIGAAFPAPAGTDRTTLEFAAHQLEEAMNPVPPDPGVFAATVTVEDAPSGPILLAQAAVLPEVAEAWEARIRSAAARLGEADEAPFFQLRRRRFRSALLLRDGPPESASLRMALDLLRDGRVRDLPADVWSVDAAQLARTAAALGEPRVLVVGPDLRGP